VDPAGIVPGCPDALVPPQADGSCSDVRTGGRLGHGKNGRVRAANAAMIMSPGGGRMLLLLRHAKSAWPDVPDHERPLAPRGRRNAPVMGCLAAYVGPPAGPGSVLHRSPVLEFSGSWNLLGPGSARLACFVTPRDLAVPE